eukprot:3947967-Amphidinium_carterae.1
MLLVQTACTMPSRMRHSAYHNVDNVDIGSSVTMEKGALYSTIRTIQVSTQLGSPHLSGNEIWRGLCWAVRFRFVPA